MKEYVSSRLFSLLSLALLVGAVVFLARCGHLDAQVTAAILAGLAVSLRSLLEAGAKTSGQSVPPEPPVPPVTVEIPPAGKPGSIGHIVAGPLGSALAALTAGGIVGLLGGCGSHQKTDTMLHILDLVAGDCAEIARYHTGDQARQIESVCNLTGAVVRIAAKPVAKDGGADSSE